MAPLQLFALHAPAGEELPEELELMAGSGAVLLVDADSKRFVTRWHWAEILSFRAQPSADPSEMDLFYLHLRAGVGTKAGMKREFVFECDNATAVVDALDDADTHGKSVATALPCHASCYFSGFSEAAPAELRSLLPEDEELVVAATSAGVRFVRVEGLSANDTRRLGDNVQIAATQNAKLSTSGASLPAGRVASATASPPGVESESESGVGDSAAVRSRSTAAVAGDGDGDGAAGVTHAVLLRLSWGQVTGWSGSAVSNDPEDMEMFCLRFALHAHARQARGPGDEKAGQQQTNVDPMDMELILEVDDAARVQEGFRRAKRSFDRRARAKAELAGAADADGSAATNESREQSEARLAAHGDGIGNDVGLGRSEGGVGVSAGPAAGVATVATIAAAAAAVANAAATAAVAAAAAAAAMIAAGVAAAAAATAAAAVSAVAAGTMRTDIASTTIDGTCIHADGTRTYDESAMDAVRRAQASLDKIRALPAASPASPSNMSVASPLSPRAALSPTATTPSPVQTTPPALSPPPVLEAAVRAPTPSMPPPPPLDVAQAVALWDLSDMSWTEREGDVEGASDGRHQQRLAGPRFELLLRLLQLHGDPAARSLMSDGRGEGEVEGEVLLADYLVFVAGFSETHGGGMLDNVVCDMLSVFDAFMEAEAQSQASVAAAATSAQSTQDDSKTSTEDSAASGLNKDGLAHMLRALNVELSAVQLMRVWGLLSSGSERVAWNRIFQAIVSGELEQLKVHDVFTLEDANTLEAEIKIVEKRIADDISDRNMIRRENSRLKRQIDELKAQARAEEEASAATAAASESEADQSDTAATSGTDTDTEGVSSARIIALTTAASEQDNTGVADDADPERTMSPPLAPPTGPVAATSWDITSPLPSPVSSMAQARSGSDDGAERSPLPSPVPLASASASSLPLPSPETEPETEPEIADGAKGSSGASVIAASVAADRDDARGRNLTGLLRDKHRRRKKKGVMFSAALEHVKEFDRREATIVVSGGVPDSARSRAPMDSAWMQDNLDSGWSGGVQQWTQDDEAGLVTNCDDDPDFVLRTSDGAFAAEDVSVTELVPNPKIVQTLTAMGFAPNGAMRAALATRNASVDEAVAWAVVHMDDATFANPLPNSIMQ